MRLPHMKYGDDITKQTQIAFGGYNHSPNAKDGEIYDMQNISSDLYPLITQRKKREGISQINAVVYRSKKYWMGNIGSKGEIFIYIPDNISLSTIIKSYDILEISVEGTYAQNSGKHIVNWVSDTSDGYTRINLHKTLMKVGDEEERPSMNDGEIPINTNEITIKIVKRVSDSSSSETVESEYVYEEFDESDVTTYTLEEDKLTIEKKVVEKADVWNKKKTVTTREVSYSEEVNYFQEEFILASSKVSNQAIYIPKASSLENNADYEMSKFRFTIANGGVLEGYASSFESANSSETTLWIAKTSSGSVANICDKQVTIELYKRHLGEPMVVETEEILDVKDNDDSNLVNTEQEWIETKVDWTVIYKRTITYSKIIKELAEHFLNVTSIYASDKICFVTDEGEFYYDGVLRGVLEKGEKQFAQTGAFLYILPDNVYYNRIAGTITEITSVRLKGYNYGAYFAGDSIDAENGQDLSMFKQGDIVTVVANSATKGIYTFKNVHVSNCKSYNGYDTIYFTENIITRDGYTLDELADGGWGWWRITITKSVPDLKYICADANRIWGCDENAIYCTSFGNPLGWYEYDASQVGNDADIAWTIEPFDSGGEFTGCCVYNDKPMFFKENKIYKVYGTKASDFQLSVEDTIGVSKGSAESICVIDSVLYYLSPEGVMRYTGNYGTCISDKFYESFENAVGGSDGVHYYITMQSGDKWKTFTYNTKNRLWCLEDDTEVKRYFNYKRNVFRNNFDGQIQCINPSLAEYPEMFEKGEMEDDFESFVEFGDFYVDVLNKKAPSKLYFRFLVEDNASIEILINYDSEEKDGERVWENIKNIESGSKKSIIVPMIPKRCDHYRIKIKGKGKWTIYAMSYEYYVGTEI